jgi:asparagine synthase (glutamine-hydrolysing)
MPGITGIISRRPANECQALVADMVASMKNEPFYTSGTYSATELGVYAGWVAHEHSFAAHQVLSNENRDIVLVMSGECLAESHAGNWAGRKGDAVTIKKGNSLIDFYEQQGEQFVEQLNGLFSGLLIDRRRGKAFLFNDRYGMERIYWCETRDGFYFASEAKALLGVLPETRRFDMEGVAQFLAYGCTVGLRTLFRGVSLLPGGSVWSFENGACRRSRYFEPATWESQDPLSVEAFESEFQKTFIRILPRYVESETKLGISLTAGLDTRMIMACLPEAARNAICYTYSGQETDILDARLAAQVAAVSGLKHEILRIRTDFFKDFGTWADRTVHATDGCFGILGAHEIYLSRQARQLSPVRLTGVFGGEILREVSTFKPVGLAPELIHPELRPSVSAAVERSRGGNEHPVSFAAFREIPQNMFGTVMACRSQLCFRSPYLDNELVALAYRAPLNLRDSCDSAIRFIRHNGKTLSEIPTDMGLLGRASGLSAVFNRIAAKLTFKLDYLSNEGLPHALSPLDPVFRRLTANSSFLGQHKYLHYRGWFRKELASYVNGLLNNLQVCQSPIWNAQYLKRLATDHISGRRNHVQEINAVLTLEAVERLLFRKIAETSQRPSSASAPALQASLAGC